MKRCVPLEAEAEAVCEANSNHPLFLNFLLLRDGWCWKRRRTVRCTNIQPRSGVSVNAQDEGDDTGLLVDRAIRRRWLM